VTNLAAKRKRTRTNLDQRSASASEIDCTLRRATAAPKVYDGSNPSSGVALRLNPSTCSRRAATACVLYAWLASDQQRAAKALQGAKGKRLTYKATDRTGPET
jgi:hypothetical protein